MSKSTTGQPALLTALAAAGPEDLAAINTRIGALEQELSTLKEAKKLLDRKLGTNAPSGDGSLGDRIVEVLNELGPSTAAAIATQVGASGQSVGRTVGNDKRFTKGEGKTWALAATEDSLDTRISDVLARVGEATPTQIADEIGSTPQAVGRALNGNADGWFRKLPTGEWANAKAGDAR